MNQITVDRAAIDFLGLLLDQKAKVEWDPLAIDYDDLNRMARAARKAVGDLRAKDLS